MDDFFPDLGLRFLEAGYRDATFTFSRFAGSMMARVGQDLYTTMANITMERVYAMSVDFDGACFEALLALQAPRARDELRRIFAGPFRQPTQVDIPQGAIVFGLRARLGEPQTNGDETYVPFVAFEIRAPEPSTSITWD